MSRAELFEIAVRAIASGAVVWALLRCIDGAPAAVTAVVISLPMVLGAGFVAVAARQDAAFVAGAARLAAQAMPALLVFVVLAARGFAALPAPALLAAAAGGWAVAALALTGSSWPLWASALAVAAALAASHLAYPVRAGLTGQSARAPALRRRAWPAASQAVTIVAALSLFSERLGPRYSALLAATPVAMIVVTLEMKRAPGRDWQAVYQSARLGVPALFAYAAALALLARPMGPTPAALAAFAPALAASAAIVSLRLRLSRGLHP